MIYVSVHTIMQFDSESDLEFYLSSDQAAQITGFAEEIKNAWRTDKPYIFNTPRPKYGAVVKSEILVGTIYSVSEEDEL